MYHYVGEHYSVSNHNFIRIYKVIYISFLIKTKEDVKNYVLLCL
jgi:hypothetical protein